MRLSVIGCLVVLIWPAEVRSATATNDIPTLERAIQGLQVAINDADTPADLKTALTPVLKAKLATLQGQLESAIKQPAAEKETGASALKIYSGDLKLVLWQEISMALSDNKDVMKLLTEWKGIQESQAEDPPEIGKAKDAVARLKALDTDPRVSPAYLKEKDWELKKAQKAYEDLVCIEVAGLRSLASDDSLTAATKTKIADRQKALLQNVPKGVCR